MSQLSSTTYNITLDLECDAWVGDASLQVSLDLTSSDGTETHETATAHISVFGITVYSTDDDGNELILSGDDAQKLSYDSYMEALLPARELAVVLHAPEENVSLEDLKFSVRDYDSAATSSFLDSSSVWVTDDAKIALKPKPYRVGSGMAVVVMEHDAIALAGESFETQIVVEIGSDPAPPVVVETEGQVEVVADDAQMTFVLDMINLHDVDNVYATVAGVTFDGQFDSGTEAGEVKFVGKEPVEEGVYDLVVKAENGEGDVDVVMTGSVELRVSAEAAQSALGVGQQQQLGGSSIGGIVGGVVAGIALLALIVGVATARWSSRRTVRDERSFTSGGGVPFEADPVYVARDVYGRGSLHQAHNASV